MISKKDCVDLANQLILELELNRKPIENIIKIDGEFIWLILENVFKTDLLPKWHCLDCVDETDEFQFILDTLEQIFELDLQHINPAYLTMRKVECVYLVLKALYLANQYIKFRKEDSSPEINSSSSESNINSSCNSCISSNDTSTNKLEKCEKSNDSQVDSTEVPLNFSHLYKSRNTIKLPKESNLPDQMKEKQKMKKIENDLNELRDDKILINELTCTKEQNFALELSYRIMDVMKIQDKSKEIKTNLNKLKMYRPNLITGAHLKRQQLPHVSSRTKPNNKNLNKNLNKNKSFAKKNLKSAQSTESRKKVQKLDLNELLEKLNGLSTKQINKLKGASERQREMVDQIKLDLIERERTLQNEMLNRVEKENKILELLQQEISLSNSAKNSSSRNQDFRKAKSELRRERVELRRQLDAYYRHNLSNCKHLESEQERNLNELAKQNDKLFREDLQEVRRDLKEYEVMMRVKQNSLLDNYENFFQSSSMMMKEEIAKHKNKQQIQMHVNDRSLSKHLEQSYKNKLYPKFD